MEILVFGNLFKLFRLVNTLAREVCYLGIKMKKNMTSHLLLIIPNGKLCKIMINILTKESDFEIANSCTRKYAI